MKPQDWLEQNYPKKGTESIYLNQQLEEVLDCSEYKCLEYIFISTSVDSSKFEIKEGSYYGGKTKIIPCPPAQTWLDKEYPSNGTCQIKNEGYELDNFGKTRAEITELDISWKGLERTLDLSGFTNLEKLDCSNNCLTNLNLNNCQELKTIWCWNNQLTTLNLSNLEQLEWLNCSDNHLTKIIYPTNPKNITDLSISNNNFSQDLTILSQMRNLRDLNISNTNQTKIHHNIYNHFHGSCQPLKDLNNLRELNISNTDLSTGWEYLPVSLEEFYYQSELRPNCQLAQNKVELEKEIWKDIHWQFAPKYKKEWLEAGFNKEQTKEFLEKERKQLGIEPKHGAFLNWFLNFKNLNLTWAYENEEEFRNLRDNYKHFGTCKECQQPNTSYKWCQSCNAKHFQAEFNTWTSGNQNIDQFIKKCQLETTSDWNVLEWIPYEKFTNIKHIADGGFGQVYKAEWEGGSIRKWNNKEKKWKRYGYYDRQQNEYKDYQIVALKTLSNSQNLNQDFLTELTLYKMFKSSVSQMVPCYGISQDPAGNYIMVMEYMEEGNLREYLRKNYQKLKVKRDTFGSIVCLKLNFLPQISQGLKDIHRKNLVHRDFHSGNIIVDEHKNSIGQIKKITCCITDLGLCKPVNETDNSQVYGVMPYVAPEVLQGQLYTQASDVYSFGIIMYEILTCLPPFSEYAHDTNLALKICQGERPQFPQQVKYPQILVDLVKKCWDQEPNNRPTAREISSIAGEWFNEENSIYEGSLKQDTEFHHQYQEAIEFNKTLPNEIKYPNYQSQEVWHSKPINTQQITQQLQASLMADLDLENLTTHTTELNLEGYETELVAQQEAPPKGNN